MGRLSNNQKAFNTVWQHFVVGKGKQSTITRDYTEEVFWVYRGLYRRRDAIGLLISDEDYNKDMEGLTIEEVVEAYPEIQLPTKDIEFLTALEWAHDIATSSDKEFSDRIRIRLRGIAEKFNLQIPQ